MRLLWIRGRESALSLSLWNPSTEWNAIGGGFKEFGTQQVMGSDGVRSLLITHIVSPRQNSEFSPDWVAVGEGAD